MAGPEATEAGSAAAEGEEWKAELKEEESLQREVEAQQKKAAAEIAGHEGELLAQMKEAVTAAGVPVEGVTDTTLMRFLRARALTIPKASAMFVEDAKWRQEYLGTKGIHPSEIESEMKANKSYLVADGKGIPWVYMFGKNHDTNTRDLEQFRKFAVFVLEKTVGSFGPGVEQFGAVLDLEATSYKNMDSRGMINLFDTLQAHYPERLSVLYVLHVPYIFWGVWKVVKPFIDPRTRQKIHFVEDKDLKTVLSEKIPSALLPKIYGGQADLVGHWEKFGKP